MALVALVLSGYTAWRTVWRTGHLVVAAPLLQGVLGANDRGVLYIFPPTFWNDGAKPLLVEDMRLRVSGPGGYSATAVWKDGFTNMNIEPNPSGGATLADVPVAPASPFWIAPQNGHAFVARFADPGFDAGRQVPGAYRAELGARVAGRWQPLATWDYDALGRQDVWEMIRARKGALVRAAF